MQNLFILCLLLPLHLTAQIISDDGYAGVEFGMSASEALVMLPGYDAESDGGNDAERGCYYLSHPEDRAAPAFMVLEGIVARVDVYDEIATAVTAAGIGIGASKQDVLATYSDVTISEHPYLGSVGEYLEVTLASDTGLIFETYQDKVTSFRLGRYPAVSYIEGCS